MAKDRPRREIPVSLGGGRTYRVVFTGLDEISDLIASADVACKRCLVVTDENVGRLYGNRFVDALEASRITADVITLPAGETTKSSEYLQRIYDSALSWGVERSTCVAALGGGVVGDLGGFAAATLLRGLPLIQVPTTLVAQVDAAIGGKTGINHPTGKNLIGAFYQPRFVLVDTATLSSLPERQWMSGLAEVVKHALIDDPEFVEFLEQTWSEIASTRGEVIDEMVYRAARVKVGVVSQDERERGRRMILNFGHTFGHAIEKVAGYGTFTHGEAVAAGMRAAIHLSKKLHPELDDARADALVAGIPVPEGLAGLDVSDLMAAMQSDKKVQDGRLRVVVLRRIGDAYATTDAKREDIEAAWRHLKAIAG